jgi:hypothetical protein
MQGGTAMTYEFISEKEPCCGLAEVAEYRQRGRDCTHLGSGRGGHRRLRLLR